MQLAEHGCLAALIGTDGLLVEGCRFLEHIRGAQQAPESNGHAAPSAPPAPGSAPSQEEMVSQA